MIKKALIKKSINFPLSLMERERERERKRRKREGEGREGRKDALSAFCERAKTSLQGQINC
jgi:hypothetical protein